MIRRDWRNEHCESLESMDDGDGPRASEADHLRLVRVRTALIVVVMIAIGLSAAEVCTQQGDCRKVFGVSTDIERPEI
jgi:hypothetical protein